MRIIALNGFRKVCEMTKEVCVLPKNVQQRNLPLQKTTLRLLIAMEYLMGSDAKGPLKGGGKISGVAIATGVSGLLHAVATL